MNTVQKEKFSFERDYFSEIYRRNYRARNPPKKLLFYLKTLLKFKTGGTLLDIGCAYGLFCQAASARFACIGCDISAHAVREAVRSSSSSRFFVSSLPAIATSEKYDVVSCFDVLEHVPDLGRSLDKIKDLLFDGTSIFLFAVPVYDGPVGRIVGLLDNDPTHLHKKSRFFWKTILADHGFDLVESVGVFRYFLLNAVYLHFGDKKWWPFAPAIVMAARKSQNERTLPEP